MVFIEHFGLSAVCLQPGLCHERHRVHRRSAVQQLSSCAGSVRSGWCVPPSSIFAVLTSLLLVLTLGGLDNGFVLWGMLFVAFGCLGLVIPSTAVLALEAHGAHAGTASALMGTLQLCTGATVIVLVSAFFNGTSMSMVAAIAGCGLTAVTLELAGADAETPSLSLDGGILAG